MPAANGEQDEDREPDDQQPDAGAGQRLEDADERGRRLVEDPAGIPALGLDLDRRDGGELVGHRQRRVARLVVELVLLRLELLDLAADVRDLRLDVEDVLDSRRLLGDLHEGGLAGLQVPDPRVEIDDLAGHVDGLGLLGDDLRGVSVQAAERVERVLPAIDRDAVGDLGVRLVVDVRGL